MPDPDGTREWAPQVTVGGPDEQKRTTVDLMPIGGGVTREYAPSAEGGPDELARATKVIVDEDGNNKVVPNDEFVATALERQKDLQDDATNEPSRQALLNKMQEAEVPEADVADPRESSEAEARSLLSSDD